MLVLLRCLGGTWFGCKLVFTLVWAVDKGFIGSYVFGSVYGYFVD